jgi:hypothetical protein
MFSILYALFEGVVFLLGMGTLLALVWLVSVLIHG